MAFVNHSKSKHTTNQPELSISADGTSDFKAIALKPMVNTPGS
ncbi:hypothetical protein [Nostoc sp.]